MSLGLARSGARIAVVAKSPDSAGLDAEIAALGSELLYLQADLSERSERQGIVERVLDHYGQIDILVNNAGIQQRAPLLDYDSAMWDYDMSVLLTAVFELSQQAARPMEKQGGGKIVHIASVASFQSARNIVGYATAKHALVGLTKSMANEWASKNINVNAIAPGIFVTDLHSHILSDPVRTAELQGRIPAARFGDPEDLVGPLIFLTSDASRHIHGHVLLVDGGWMGR